MPRHYEDPEKKAKGDALRDTLVMTLRLANQARVQGVPRSSIDQAVQDRTGLPNYDALVEAVRNTRYAPDDAGEFTAGDIGRSVAQGATFNFGDELYGAAKALLTDESYSSARDRFRELDDRFRRNHPGIAFTSELLGGVAVPGLGAAGVLGKGASSLTLGQKLAAAGIGGLGAGALAGAGSARTMQDVPKSAAIGGAAGALGGLGVAGVTSALGAIPALANRMQGVFAPQAAGAKGAQRQVAEAARRGGVTPEGVIAGVEAMEQVRPGQSMPADVHPQFRRLLRKEVNEASGPAADEAVLGARTRRAGAGERLAEDVRGLGGFGDRTAEEGLEAAEERLAARGRELFGPLEDEVLQADRRLKDLLADPDVQPIWARVRPRGQKSPQRFGSIQALRGRLKDARNKALISGETEYAAAIKDRMADLDEILDDIVPGFRGARAGYARTAQQVNAFEMGAKTFRNGSARRVQREMAQLAERAGDEAPEAIDAYRHALVDEMIEDLTNRATNLDIGAKYANRGAAKMRVVRAAFPDERSFQQFLERATLESRFAELSHALTGNSTSAQQFSDLLRQPVVAESSPFRAFIREIMRTNPEAATRQATDVVEALTQRGTPGAQRVAQMIEQGAPSTFEQGMRSAGASQLPVGLPPAFLQMYEMTRNK